jgi:hypothetical protein
MERRFRIRAGTTTVFTSAYGDFPTLGGSGIAVSANNSAYNLGVEARDRLWNTTAFINQVIATVLHPPAFLAQCGVAPCQLTSASNVSHNLSTFGYDPDDPTGLRTAIGVGALPNQLGHVANTWPGGTNFEFSATDVISGFAQGVGTPTGSRALLHSHITVLATPASPGGALTAGGLASLIGSGAISTTPFSRSAAGTGFVNTPSNAGAYVQTPTSITTAAAPAVLVNGGVIATPIQEIYQAQARDRAGNLTAIIGWHVYTNNGTNPFFTGLVASSAFIGGVQATFPGVAQDGPGPVFGNEVYQGSFDLQYAGMAHLIYERPSPQASTLFDDFIMMPQPISFMTGASGTPTSFIQAIQGVTVGGLGVGVDGEPVTGHAPTGAPGVKPSWVNARSYNATLEGATATTFPCHNYAAAVLVAIRPCHITNGAPAADGTTGSSAHLPASILSTQVSTGTGFAAPPGALNIANFYIASIQVSAASGSPAVRTATIRIRARGPTITFLNPFPSGLLVVEQIQAAAGPGGGPYLRPVAGTLTPQFLPGLPTLDNGTIRDFDWVFVFTLPAMTPADGILTNGDRVIRVIGLDGDFDGLRSNGAAVPFDATTALTFPVGITYVP